MEHFRNIERRDGVCIGYKDDLHPEDGRGRVGKSGFDKTLRLNNIIDIAYTMENPRPNIIVKGGSNAKWYLKYCEEDKIDQKIEKTKWLKNAKMCTTYIIQWM